MSRHLRALDGRQRTFVEGVAEGKSMARAAREAGYSPSTAAKKAYAMIDRPLIKTALTDALLRQGGTMERIIRPIVDGLEANIVVTTKAGLLF